MAKLKIIYISGVGRSGSTLIDLLLNTSKDVLALGEIYWYHDYKNGKVECCCGLPIDKCSYWRDIGRRDIRIESHANAREYLKVLNYLYNPFCKEVRYKNRSDNTRLFRKVIDNSVRNIKYISDSSKDLTRLIELENDPGIEVYNVNIVRDGRAVANSFNSKTQSKGKGYFVSLIKWVLVNKFIFRYQKIKLGNRMNLSYEELCKNPQVILHKLNKYLVINISTNYIDTIKTMEYHGIGTNRLAKKSNRNDFNGINYDDKWKRTKSSFTKSLATMITRRFNKKWIYNMQPKTK